MNDPRKAYEKETGKSSYRYVSDDKTKVSGETQGYIEWLETQFALLSPRPSMPPITYLELANIVTAKMPADQARCNISVYDALNDEYFTVNTILYAEADNGILDEGHPYLVFNQEE